MTKQLNSFVPYTASQKSSLSTHRAGTSGNETPGPQASTIEQPHPEVNDVPMDIEHLKARDDAGSLDIPQILDATIPVYAGPIIIEELDTPATRREKRMRRKSERETAGSMVEPWLEQWEVKDAGAHTDPVARVETPRVAIGSQVPGDEKDSELSSLSELTDPDVEMTTSSASMEPSGSNVLLNSLRRSSRNVEPVQDRGAIVLPRGKTLPGGTLVWAKAGEMRFLSFAPRMFYNAKD